MRLFVTAITAILFCLCAFACQSEKNPVPLPAEGAPQAEQLVDKGQEPQRTEAEPTPPGIPVTETFDKEPQLSLFPRIAAYRPTDDDSKNLDSWRAYIDHVQRKSGMRPQIGQDNSNGWVIRGIKGISSVAFFAPLAVKPSTRYQVTFDFKGDLPKDASAGIGALEFKEFLWIGEQFTEGITKEYQSGSIAGISLKNDSDWQRHSFEFTTSPRAGMIHLILHRNDVTEGNTPVFFDNISITEVH